MRIIDTARIITSCSSLLVNAAMKVEMRDRKNIPQEQNFLIASNHRSILDPFIINRCLHTPVRWMGANFMNDIPIIRGLSRLAGTISAPAAGNMAREAIKKIFALPPNIPLGIFPEGYEPLIKMKDPLPLCSFHRGFAYIAARTAKPILPISIIPIHEYPVEYPFPISIRKLFIPHKELCELKTRITYKKVAVVFHPPVPPPNRSASRSELLDFGSHIQVIVSKPLEAYFLESQDEHR